MKTPRRSRAGGKCALVIFCVIALVILAWWGWRNDWLTQEEPGQSRTSTNTPVSHPTTVSRISTTLVTRAIVPVLTNASAAPADSMLEAQIALDRRGISAGSIDGVAGAQTRSALRAFQLQEGFPQTGELDTATRARLALSRPALTRYVVSAGDVSRLLPLAATWLGKSEQPRLDYESLLELVAEKSHAHPNLIRRLNAGVDWSARPTGAEIVVPSVERDAPSAKAAFIQIRLSDRTLEAFDSANTLLAHFPCSIAKHADKRPIGELHVTVLAPNPDYTFNPENFPESAEARELKTKLKLQPGPNNPVGSAWIGLNLPGYGIHGTPKPEEVGRTESHGCFRLANWNAEYLLRLVTIGTAVRVEP